MQLFSCSDLTDIREKDFKFNVDSLKVLFKEVSSDITLNMLKEINIFYKLSVLGKKYTLHFVFNSELFD